MEFNLESNYPTSASKVFYLLSSENYLRASDTRDQSEESTLINESWNGNVLTRVVDVVSREEFPSFIAALVGVKRKSYRTEHVFDRDALTLRWRIIPPKLQDRMGVWVEEKFEDADTGGSKRQIVFRIEANVPLIGGRIEKTLSEELKAGYEEQLTFDGRWVEMELGAREVTPASA